MEKYLNDQPLNFQQDSIFQSSSSIDPTPTPTLPLTWFRFLYNFCVVLTFIIKSGVGDMYKNKIKTKLQKMYCRGIDGFNQKPLPTVAKDQVSFVRSPRRGKLSLSKDLSVASNSSYNNSRQPKKSYIRLVSNSCQKDLSLLSNSKICLTPQVGSERIRHNQSNAIKEATFFKEESSHKRKDSSFDVRQLREMANNIARSTAILNDKIVPVLLQAAAQGNQKINSPSVMIQNSSKVNKKCQGDHSRQNSIIFQTPINELKSQSLEKDYGETAKGRKTLTNRCQTEPSESYAHRLQSKHKISHSPTPVKNKSPIKIEPKCKDLSLAVPQAHFFQEETHPLVKQLQVINNKRKVVEQRISKKLDEMSNKATSIAKPQLEDLSIKEHPKKPKILKNSTRTNIVLNGPQKMMDQKPGLSSSTSRCQVQLYESDPREKNKNIRSLIMNRIFS